MSSTFILQNMGFNIKRMSQEPVLKKTYIFFAISGMTIIFILIFYFVMEFSANHYFKFENNKRVKNYISFHIQQKIRSLQVEFQYMLLSVSTIELNTTNEKIKNDIKFIKKAIYVIENGGVYTEELLAEDGKDEKIQQRVRYIAPKNMPKNLSSIKMKNHLNKIEEMRMNYFEVMEKRLYLYGEREQGDLLFYHNKIAKFFDKLIEISSHLYIDNQDTYLTAENKLKTRTNFIIIFSCIFIPCFLLLSTFVAIRILQDIRRLVYERSRAIKALKSANENLEALVSRRTFALRQEVKERQHAEERFAKQAGFLTNVLESLSHPFYVINCHDYSINMANQAAKDLAIENPNYSYIFPDGQGEKDLNIKSLNLIDEVKKTKLPIIIDDLRRTPSGEMKMFEIHGYPIFNKSGHVVQMIKYCLDVTEKYLARKALEHAMDELEEKVKKRTALLRNSERHFRNLIEGIRDIITILDKRGRITYISPSVYHVLGYDPKKMIGKSFRKYTNVPVRVASEFFSKGNDSHEHELFDISGIVHTMESTIQNKFDDPSINGILITSRDVSTRKNAELNQKRLHMVVEQNPSSVVITDTRGCIEYVNPEFEKVTGYSKEEALGKNPNILNSGLTSPETFVDLYETIGKGNVWRGEFINRRCSGELYTENVIIVPIKDDNGKISNFVALKENITELKKAREQAEIANAAKTEFLSRMSHELRTPLNAIIGFSTLLLENKQAVLVEKQVEQMHHIQNAGQHLMQMIEKILDFSKVDSSSFAVNMENILPGEIVYECVSLTEHLTQTNNIALIVEESVHEMPTIQVDRTRFKQILVNLISNAIKYNIPNGAVTISASASHDTVMLTVIDTGIGIALEKQAELFTPFTRFSDQSFNIEGTGIGMTITKQLVEAMGGEINFTSKEHKGSQFTISFPLYEEESLVVNEKENPLFTQRAFFTVLYIDNDINRIKEIRHLFAMWSKATLVVRKESKKALKTVSLMQPDLVLLCDDFRYKQNGIEKGLQENLKEGAVLLIVNENISQTNAKVEENVCLQFPLTIKKITDAITTLEEINGKLR